MNKFKYSNHFGCQCCFPLFLPSLITVEKKTNENILCFCLYSFTTIKISWKISFHTMFVCTLCSDRTYRLSKRKKNGRLCTTLSIHFHTGVNEIYIYLWVGNNINVLWRCYIFIEGPWNMLMICSLIRNVSF